MARQPSPEATAPPSMRPADVQSTPQLPRYRIQCMTAITAAKSSALGRPFVPEAGGRSLCGGHARFSLEVVPELDARALGVEEADDDARPRATGLDRVLDPGCLEDECPVADSLLRTAAKDLLVAEGHGAEGIRSGRRGVYRSPLRSGRIEAVGVQAVGKGEPSGAGAAFFTRLPVAPGTEWPT